MSISNLENDKRYQRRLLKVHLTAFLLNCTNVFYCYICCDNFQTFLFEFFFGVLPLCDLDTPLSFHCPLNLRIQFPPLHQSHRYLK